MCNNYQGTPYPGCSQNQNKYLDEQSDVSLGSHIPVLLGALALPHADVNVVFPPKGSECTI